MSTQMDANQMTYGHSNQENLKLINQCNHRQNCEDQTENAQESTEIMVRTTSSSDALQKNKTSNIQTIMKSCIFCLQFRSSRSFGPLLTKALYSKYASSQNYFYSKDINDILGNARTTLVINFRDQEVLAEETEYLRRFYPKSQQFRKFTDLTEYYKFHKDISRIFIKNEMYVINQFHDQHRKIEYRRIKKLLNLELSSHQSNQSQSIEDQDDDDDDDEEDKTEENLKGKQKEQHEHHHDQMKQNEDKQPPFIQRKKRGTMYCVDMLADLDLSLHFHESTKFKQQVPKPVLLSNMNAFYLKTKQQREEQEENQFDMNSLINKPSHLNFFSNKIPTVFDLSQSITNRSAYLVDANNFYPSEQSLIGINSIFGEQEMSSSEKTRDYNNSIGLMRSFQLQSGQIKDAPLQFAKRSTTIEAELIKKFKESLKLIQTNNQNRSNNKSSFKQEPQNQQIQPTKSQQQKPQINNQFLNRNESSLSSENHQTNTKFYSTSIPSFKSYEDTPTVGKQFVQDPHFNTKNILALNSQTSIEASTSTTAVPQIHTLNRQNISQNLEKRNQSKEPTIDISSPMYFSSCDLIESQNSTLPIMNTSKVITIYQQPPHSSSSVNNYSSISNQQNLQQQQQQAQHNQHHLASQTSCPTTFRNHSQINLIGSQQSRTLEKQYNQKSQQNQVKQVSPERTTSPPLWNKPTTLITSNQQKQKESSNGESKIAKKKEQTVIDINRIIQNSISRLSSKNTSINQGTNQPISNKQIKPSNSMTSILKNQKGQAAAATANVMNQVITNSNSPIIMPQDHGSNQNSRRQTSDQLCQKLLNSDLLQQYKVVQVKKQTKTQSRTPPPCTANEKSSSVIENKSLTNQVSPTSLFNYLLNQHQQFQQQQQQQQQQQVNVLKVSDSQPNLLIPPTQSQLSMTQKSKVKKEDLTSSSPKAQKTMLQHSKSSREFQHKKSYSSFQGMSNNYYNGTGQTQMQASYSTSADSSIPSPKPTNTQPTTTPTTESNPPKQHQKIHSVQIPFQLQEPVQALPITRSQDNLMNEQSQFVSQQQQSLQNSEVLNLKIPNEYDSSYSQFSQLSYRCQQQQKIVDQIQQLNKKYIKAKNSSTNDLQKLDPNCQIRANSPIQIIQQGEKVSTASGVQSKQIALKADALTQRVKNMVSIFDSLNKPISQLINQSSSKLKSNFPAEQTNYAQKNIPQSDSSSNFMHNSSINNASLIKLGSIPIVQASGSIINTNQAILIPSKSQMSQKPGNKSCSSSNNSQLVNFSNQNQSQLIVHSIIQKQQSTQSIFSGQQKGQAQAASITATTSRENSLNRHSTGLQQSKTERQLLSQQNSKKIMSSVGSINLNNNQNQQGTIKKEGSVKRLNTKSSSLLNFCPKKN